VQVSLTISMQMLILSKGDHLAHSRKDQDHSRTKELQQVENMKDNIDGDRKMSDTTQFWQIKCWCFTLFLERLLIGDLSKDSTVDDESWKIAEKMLYPIYVSARKRTNHNHNFNSGAVTITKI